MRGHTFHQPIEPNKDITMKRKNLKAKTQARKTVQPSQRWWRQKALEAQHEQAGASADAADAIATLVTRYELDGIALFSILPEHLECMHPNHIEDLISRAEEGRWRLTLQTASACFVITLHPHELDRTLLANGLSIVVNKTESEVNADASVADSAGADPSAPTDDGPASTPEA